MALNLTMDKRGNLPRDKDKVDSDQVTTACCKMLSAGLYAFSADLSGLRGMEGFNTFVSHVLRNATENLESVYVRMGKLMLGPMSANEATFRMERRGDDVWVRGVGQDKFEKVQRFVKLGVHNVNIERLLVDE